MQELLLILLRLGFELVLVWLLWSTWISSDGGERLHSKMQPQGQPRQRHPQVVVQRVLLPRSQGCINTIPFFCYQNRSRVRPMIDPALAENEKIRRVLRSISELLVVGRRAWDAHWVHHLGTEKQDLSPRAFPDWSNSEGRVSTIVDPANVPAGSRLAA